MAAISNRGRRRGIAPRVLWSQCNASNLLKLLGLCFLVEHGTKYWRDMAALSTQSEDKHPLLVPIVRDTASQVAMMRQAEAAAPYKMEVSQETFQQRKEKKIVSFGLFSGKYRQAFPPWLEKGVWANIEGYHIYFPDWICRLYITVDTMPPSFMKKLRNSPIPVEVVETEDWGHSSITMMQRFLPFDDPNVSMFVVRDLDSRPSVRELLAVNEWIGSDHKFHVMRDNPTFHKGFPIIGCCWGAKRGALGNKKIGDILADFRGKNGNKPHDDQRFLATYVWPIVKDDTFQHDPDNKTSYCGENGCHDYPLGSLGYPEFHIGHPFKTDEESGRSFLYDQFQCFSTCSMTKLECKCEIESHKVHNRRKIHLGPGDWQFEVEPPLITPDVDAMIEAGILSNTSECPGFDCAKH